MLAEDVRVEGRHDVDGQKSIALRNSTSTNVVRARGAMILLSP
jgi:hypothetical protein